MQNTQPPNAAIEPPETATAPDFIGSATYSPEDNKIRITPFARLSPELYARVKAAGYSWAPRQKIFVAPMWSPDREDLAAELCGDVGDEDKSLVERAEERAERFDEYSDKRAADAESAHAAVAKIADGIPMGQPILIGHHSERHARKDAERIQNGMRKAVKMWETSKYWIERAKGALRHAKYKELPDVRARRIKGIEADRRRQLRSLDEAVAADVFWNNPELTHAEALAHAGRSGCGFTMPRKEGDRPDFDQRPSEYNALSGSFPNLYAPRTFEEVRAAGAVVFKPRIERATRWIAHYDNRLAYEKAMLEEQGASHLIAPRSRPTQLPLLNYKCETVTAERWGKVQTFKQVELSGANYARINSDQKGTLIVDESHRMRFGFVEIHEDGTAARFPNYDRGHWVAVFITDSKAHAKPTKAAPPPEAEAKAGPDAVQDITQGRTIWNSDGRDGPALICAPSEDKGAKFAAMKSTLKAGIKVVTAPQLFPTPHDLAQRVADLAEIQPDHRVLEPSAGTGALLNGITVPFREVVAVEVSVSLADNLRRTQGDRCKVINADFLQCNGDLGEFDRVIMNPPFAKGADVLHVRHALNKLKVGGKLVGICANGPRQKACLEPLADFWEPLPDGTFSDQGTNVRTVLFVIEKRD